MDYVIPYFKSLHSSLFRTKGNFEHLLSDEGKRRLRLLKKFDLLQQQGVSPQKIADVLEVSVATLYRWRKLRALEDYKKLEPKSRGPLSKRKSQWSYPLEQRVLQLRRTYPMWGKSKLYTLVKKEGYSTSESTVGRILKKLRERGLLQSIYELCKPLRKKRKIQRKHAQRKPKDLKVNEPGDLVEIDHMTIHDDGCQTIKHFGAQCVISKWNVVDIFRRATAKNAAEFLDKVIQEMPFTVRGIQVDGGSEFMKDFEQACLEKNIPLYVLPPKSPKLNGDIERNNGTWRYEFYWFQDTATNLYELRPKVYERQDIQNKIRPHQTLQNLTPLEYLKNRYPQKEALFS